MSIVRRQTRNILYISYDGLTDVLGQSQILPYLLGLADSTTKIAVVSCEKPANLAKRKALIEKTISGHNIAWVPLGYTKSPPIFSSIKDIAAVGRTAARLHAEQAFDIVHCRSYLPSIVGLRLKRRHGVRFLFDMRGFWADERVDGNMWNLANPAYRLVYTYFKRKERAFLAEADHVVSLTEAARREMLTWPGCGQLDTKLSVIPCCVDTQLFDPAKVTPERLSAARERLGLAQVDDVVVYLGTIGTWYMLDEMLDFFRAYLASHPAGKLLLVTQEAAEPIVANAMARGIARDRLVITSAERAEVPVFVSLARYGLFFIKPAYSKMSSSPTKQGELMALGIPVICNGGVGDTAAVVGAYKSGVVVESFDEMGYQAAIDKLAGTQFSPEAISAGAEAYCGLDHGIERYRRIYDSLAPVAR